MSSKSKKSVGLVISEKGLIEEITSSMATSFGYKPEDLIGQPATLVLPQLTEASADSVVLDMEAEMRKALKNGEFFLNYQPQFDIKENKIIGFEALMRWQHPVKGLIPPNVFIPIAESSGLISDLCAFVLDAALVQLKKWQKAGYKNLLIAINLSAAQFGDESLVKLVGKALEKHKVKKGSLELELTETLLMQDIDTARQILKELVAKGVRVAIDDFGVGYSSLNYLLQFPVHKIKIDKSFIQDMSRTKKNTRLVEAIINLGHALDLDVIAEGVEEKKQLNALRDMNCDLVQGFLLGRPLDVGTATALLKENNQ